jgi:SAM-dependent methyltransferase
VKRFGNVYEDSARAQAYAQLGFPGTYYLAFRDLPDLFRKYVHGTKALDFGCGTGRSSRFLEGQGFTTIGVDISAVMLEEARRRAPQGDYRLVTARSIGEFTDRFDLVLAAFTFDNIPTNEAKVEALTTLRGLLAPQGTVISIVSTPAIYRHEWASFSTRDFPENQRARDGDIVHIIMLDVPDRRPVDDVLCSDSRYRALFARAGLAVKEMIQPLATGKEPTAWVSETHTAAWSVYVLDEGLRSRKAGRRW